MNNGDYSIDQFKKFGGTADFTYNEATKKVEVNHQFVYLDQNNNLKTKYYDPYSILLKDVDVIKNQLLKDLNAQYQFNIKEFNK